MRVLKHKIILRKEVEVICSDFYVNLKQKLQSIQLLSVPLHTPTYTQLQVVVFSDI